MGGLPQTLLLFWHPNCRSLACICLHIIIIMIIVAAKKLCPYLLSPGMRAHMLPCAHSGLCRLLNSAARHTHIMHWLTVDDLVSEVWLVSPATPDHCLSTADHCLSTPDHCLSTADHCCLLGSWQTGKACFASGGQSYQTPPQLEQVASSLAQS